MNGIRPSADPGTPNPRHLDLLAELAELGMELAREVATLTKTRIAEARESGWDGNLPKDPAAPFARLAQAVRRTIALEVALRQGAAALGENGGGLFAPADGGVDLHPKFTLWEDAPSTPPPPDAALSDAADAPEGPMSVRAIVADDLGRALEDRERLFDIPNAPTDALIDGLRRDLGLDLGESVGIHEGPPTNPLTPQVSWTRGVPPRLPGAGEDARGPEAVADPCVNALATVHPARLE